MNHSLTLRSKLNGLELTKGSKSRMECCNIEFGFKGKGIEMSGFTQPFELDVSTEGGKQMVGLGRDGLSRRLFKGSILLEGFMVGFHVPSFTIDSGHLVGGQGAITGHQILNPRTAIFVYEDLLEQQEREIDTFQIDFHRGIRFECQLVETHPLPIAFGVFTQGDFAISPECDLA